MAELKSFFNSFSAKQQTPYVPEPSADKTLKTIYPRSYGREDTKDIAENFYIKQKAADSGAYGLRLYDPEEIDIVKRLKEDANMESFYDYAHTKFNKTNIVENLFLQEELPEFFERQKQYLDQAAQNYEVFLLSQILPPMSRFDYFLRFARKLGFPDPSPLFWLPPAATNTFHDEYLDMKTAYRTADLKDKEFVKKTHWYSYKNTVDFAKQFQELFN